MNTLHVKKGDKVILLTGKYQDKYETSEGKSDKAPKRKVGTVVAVSPKEGKVIVEGINLVTKHVRPRRAGEPGGLVKAEAPIYACKVMAVCPACKEPTRPAYKFVEGKDGKQEKQRVCKHCGKAY
ncbi:MAG: 50S ribosomal protein L24 [Oscillospiraceae bacterium]|nr:50S ribosomal protein L24 [Oscillospiraceae bacterium]